MSASSFPRTDPVVRSLSQQLRTLARLAAQWADVLDAEHDASIPPTPVPSPVGKPETAPVLFSCALCGARSVWDVAGYAKPWPGAMCSNCYAELRMRRDEIQDQALGYTGVR